ncbi:MAG: metal-dependent transcriptional regulator [Gulosibacter sp.]|uniref:metal-dependent transcriptional regulator n=1 Tax=Gulosibacter sp. TaxID=2817531 RepID=UPI003F8E5C73
MSVSDLTASTQNYLKVIWSLREWSEEPVTPTHIAERTGLRVSTVSGAMSKLAAQGLVEHAPYGSITLTKLGTEYAVTMVRRHRLIETFLVQSLGYRWDQVHDEADRLEHAVSDFMVERMNEVLGSPERDPHGDPIPSSSGAMVFPEAKSLTQVEPERAYVVERISDDDPELLRFFADKGIVVGAVLWVRTGAPYSASINVDTEKTTDTALGRPATDSIWVSQRADS